MTLSFACGSCVTAPEPAVPVHAAVTTILIPDLHIDYVKGSPNEVAVIRFNVPVDDISAAVLVSLLEGLPESLSSLVIELDTPGGIVSSGHDIARAIEGAPVPVICIVDGQAASTGFYLLQSCDVRVITMRSRLMVHEAAVQGVRGDPQTLRNDLKSLESLNMGLAWHNCHRLNVPVPDCQNRFSHGLEWWMTPEEALNVGAVDAVIPTVEGFVYHLRFPP